MANSRYLGSNYATKYNIQILMRIHVWFTHGNRWFCTKCSHWLVVTRFFVFLAVKNFTPSNVVKRKQFRYKGRFISLCTGTISVLAFSAGEILEISLPFSWTQNKTVLGIQASLHTQQHSCLMLLCAMLVVLYLTLDHWRHRTHGALWRLVTKRFWDTRCDGDPTMESRGCSTPDSLQTLTGLWEPTDHGISVLIRKVVLGIQRNGGINRWDVQEYLF